MPETFAIKDGRDGMYLSIEAKNSFNILGMITPVTDRADKVLTFDDQTEAQRYADKCNRSPMAKWQVVSH